MATQIDRFDPRLWLAAFAQIGGAYVLMSDRKLALLIDDCEPDVLTPMMAQVVGHPERQDAIKAAIERRQIGDVQ